jgi:hypothetical protein
MFWFEIGSGETTAHEYGAIPGVKYGIVDHDGTWLDIYTKLGEGWEDAKEVADRGDLPIALVVDSMSGVWGMLCEFGDLRARRKAAEKLEKRGQNPKSAFSPEADVTITTDLWNLVNKRHRSFMAKILTWPGPVVVIAREKLVTQFDDKGNPAANKPKEWSLEAQKGLGFDCSAWVRMTRTEHPEVVKLRSVKNGIQPEVDSSKKRPDFTLAKLIFEWVGCESGVSRAPDVRMLDADQVMPGEDPAADKAAADLLLAKKREVMAAGKTLGHGFPALKQMYGEQYEGADIMKASVERLVEFQEFLAQCAAKPVDEPAASPVRAVA